MAYTFISFKKWADIDANMTFCKSDATYDLCTWASFTPQPCHAKQLVVCSSHMKTNGAI